MAAKSTTDDDSLPTVFPSFMVVDYSIYLVTGRDLLPPGKVVKVCNIRQLIVKGASGLPRVLGRGRVYQYAASSVTYL